MTTPRVSVVTTVYDRAVCLDRCLRAMAHSRYRDFEHIVVADHPSCAVLRQIEQVVRQACTRVPDSPPVFVNLPTRHNDWGMTPAWAGVTQARGEFVCFLSDDNAYLPDHLGPLVALLDQHPDVGFVYSSCLYAGRTVLRDDPPRGARIDLGQPLFRTDVLRRTFPKGLPFREFAWDWRMIAGLMDAGVTWKHHDAATFVFRLAAYPKLVAEVA
jgi:glycosyltransferase involved in cell wall biosynthesis